MLMPGFCLFKSRMQTQVKMTELKSNILLEEVEVPQLSCLLIIHDYESHNDCIITILIIVVIARRGGLTFCRGCGSIRASDKAGTLPRTYSV